MIAAISAVVLSGCKKERSFRGANPGDEIVFGGTAGSASGFRSSKTKGCDGDSSAGGVLAVTGLDASNMESCISYDRDADETYFFDWEDFEGGDAFGGSSSDNAINDGVLGVTSCTSFSYGEYFGGSENDVQTKTEYSGQRDASGKYERIDWKVGDKIKIYANGVKPPKTECVYKVDDVTTSGIRSSAGLSPFNEADGHGLMWDGGNADFYAFYPGNSPAKVFTSNTPSNFDVTVKLPKEQNTFTKTTSGNHTEVKPDMELAAMMAVSRNVSPTSSVQLDFLPLVTTFRISIGNPSTTDDITINKVSVCYTPLASTPKPMSGNYAVQYDKTSGGTLSSHSSAGLQPVNTSSITSPEQEISVDLGTDAVTLTKNNGNTLSVTLFAVPVQHKGLQLKINVTQGGNTEDRILYLEKKQTTPFTPAEQLEFEPYKKYDINVGVDKKWTYVLSFTDMILHYIGADFSLWINSYKTDGVTIKPVPWRVEGYSETGPTGPFTSTKPTWLTSFTSHGDGGYSPSGAEHVRVSVSSQMVVSSTNARTIALRSKDRVGLPTAIDLSRVPMGTSPFFSIPDGANASTYSGNPMNTANCYVVTRPGWYKIPVVYGNAIKGTASDKERANTEAYNPSVSHPNVLKPFIRHDGQVITKPWIKDNINLEYAFAELTWQDWPLLVQNIEFDSINKKYIAFYVSKEAIHEGNAVIALKDKNGVIVWSWHIWVYGGDNLKSINVKNNKAKSGGRPGQDNFDFLSENLGSCYDSGEYVTFPAANVWVKISNGRKPKVIKITRYAGPSFTTASYYNTTFYQWGRKDPMLPSDGIASNQNKFWFDKDGTIKNNLQTDNWSSDGTPNGANAEIANIIKNPHTFNTSSNMDNLYYNLWDASCNEAGSYYITTARFLPAIKSVYDPCPPGFCLPPSGAFTGFTSTGDYSSTSSKLNVSGPFNNGYNFRTVLKGESGGETIFFPALGLRYYGNGLMDLSGNSGYYWSGDSFNETVGCILFFISGIVYPMSNNNRSSGFAVRPVAEN